MSTRYAVWTQDVDSFYGTACAAISQCLIDFGVGVGCGDGSGAFRCLSLQWFHLAWDAFHLRSLSPYGPCKYQSKCVQACMFVRSTFHLCWNCDGKQIPDIFCPLHLTFGWLCFTKHTHNTHIPSASHPAYLQTICFPLSTKSPGLVFLMFFWDYAGCFSCFSKWCLRCFLLWLDTLAYWICHNLWLADTVSVDIFTICFLGLDNWKACYD